MKTFYLEELPSFYGGDIEYESSTISDDEYLYLKQNHLKYLFYWYARGSYCGAGQFLMLTADDKWVLHDGSHCSCYGPLGDHDYYTDSYSVDFKNTYDSLDALMQNASDDYKSSVQPLVDLARAEGLN